MPVDRGQFGRLPRGSSAALCRPLTSASQFALRVGNVLPQVDDFGARALNKH
jgi:hypothetical protein